MSRSGRCLFAALLVTTTGCQSARLEPISSRDFVPEGDELLLWTQSERIHEELVDADLLLQDRAAQERIDRVARRIAEASGAGDIDVRTHVVLNPYPVAYSLPNGNLYLHTGVLTKMTDEGQLAYQLAHVIAHFLHRHRFREQMSYESRFESYEAAGVVTTLLSGGNHYLGAWLVIMGGHALARDQLAGYSAELEREADRIAVETVTRAGYDANGALRLLRALEDGRIHGESASYYFESRSDLEGRIEELEELIDSRGDGAQAAVPIDVDFNLSLSEVRLRNASIDLDLGRLSSAKQAIDQHLRFSPESARGMFALAEYHRRHDRDPAAPDLALEAYRSALRLDPALAEAHREIGLMEVERGNNAVAAAHLARYLDLRPTAPDKAIVESYLPDEGTR